MSKKKKVFVIRNRRVEKARVIGIEPNCWLKEGERLELEDGYRVRFRGGSVGEYPKSWVYMTRISAKQMLAKIKTW